MFQAGGMVLASIPPPSVLEGGGGVGRKRIVKGNPLIPLLRLSGVPVEAIMYPLGMGTREGVEGHGRNFRPPRPLSREGGAPTVANMIYR